MFANWIGAPQEVGHAYSHSVDLKGQGGISREYEEDIAYPHTNYCYAQKHSFVCASKRHKSPLAFNPKNFLGVRWRIKEFGESESTRRIPYSELVQNEIGDAYCVRTMRKLVLTILFAISPCLNPR